MAHGGSRGEGRAAHRRAGVSGSLARVGRRLGVALLGAALPALLATVGAAALVDGAASDPLGWVDGAVGTTLLGGQGLGWAFHVALFVGVVGLVTLALSFVCEGLSAE